MTFKQEVMGSTAPMPVSGDGDHKGRRLVSTILVMAGVGTAQEAATRTRIPARTAPMIPAASSAMVARPTLPIVVVGRPMPRDQRRPTP